jgi:phage gp36-like protein
VGSENLVESELRAISELDPLRAKFDIAGMMEKVGEERHPVMIRILVHITAYYLYNTVPDDEIPGRIVDNWKKELQFIKDLASGKTSSTLNDLTSETTGEKVTSFRWGSNKKRSHDLY